jgi:hypothetical protein
MNKRLRKYLRLTAMLRDSLALAVGDWWASGSRAEFAMGI